MHFRIFIILSAIVLVGSVFGILSQYQQQNYYLMQQNNALQEQLNSIQAQSTTLSTQLSTIEKSVKRPYIGFSTTEIPQTLDGRPNSFTWNTVAPCTKTQDQQSVNCNFKGNDMYQTIISNASNSMYPFLDSRDFVLVSKIDQTRPLRSTDILGKPFIYWNEDRNGTIIHSCILFNETTQTCVEYGLNNAISFGEVNKSRIEGVVQWSCRRY